MNVCPLIDKGCLGEHCILWIGDTDKGGCAIVEGVAWLGHIADNLARLGGGKPEAVTAAKQGQPSQSFDDGPVDEKTVHIVESLAEMPIAEVDAQTPCLVSVEAAPATNPMEAQTVSPLDPAFLRTIEWGGSVKDVDGNLVEVCPECRGTNPKHVLLAEISNPKGHHADCKLASILAANEGTQ